MGRHEKVLLGAWDRTTTLSATTTGQPTAASGTPTGELDANQRAEITDVVIYPPVTNAGAVQTLLRVNLLLDDKEIAEYVNLPGRYDCLMTPPGLLTEGVTIPFGMGLEDSLAAWRGRGLSPLLTNTTLKYADNVRPTFTAGASDVIQPFRVEVWGHIYREEEIAAIWAEHIKAGGASSLPLSVSLRDSQTGKIMVARKPRAPVVSFGDWTAMVGGAFQDKTVIMPFWRFAFTAANSSLNTMFQFRYDNSQVATANEALYWDFIKRREGLLIQGFGMRRPLGGTGAWTASRGWIQRTGDSWYKDHPQRGYYLSEFRAHPLFFGATDGVLPYPGKFVPLPRFAQGRELLIYDDVAHVTFVDDAANVVSSGQLIAAVKGIKFDLAD